MASKSEDANWWLVDVCVKDKIVRLSCHSSQRVKWLGNVGIARYDEEHAEGWRELGIPVSISKADGTKLEFGAVIREVLHDNAMVIVETSVDPTDAEARD